jgi:hypothetical protein
VVQWCSTSRTGEHRAHKLSSLIVHCYQAHTRMGVSASNTFARKTLRGFSRKKAKTQNFGLLRCHNSPQRFRTRAQSRCNRCTITQGSPTNQNRNSRKRASRMFQVAVRKSSGQVGWKEIIDERDNRYGRLVVSCFARMQNERAYWECDCDCGNVVAVSGSALRRGTTKSCGCLRVDTSRDWMRKSRHTFKTSWHQCARGTDGRFKSKSKVVISNGSTFRD